MDIASLRHVEEICIDARRDRLCKKTLSEFTLGRITFRIFSSDVSMLRIVVEANCKCNFECSWEIPPLPGIRASRAQRFQTKDRDVLEMRIRDSCCVIPNFFDKFIGGSIVVGSLTLTLHGPSSLLAPKSKIEVPSFSLEDAMDKLLDHGQGDITFVIAENGKRINVHSEIIKQFLTVPILHDSMKEASSKEILIEDANFESFASFIRYIYTGRVKEADMEKYAEELLVLGDRYNNLRLVRLCESYLICGNLVTCENVCRLMRIAHQHGAPHLLNECLNFFASEQRQVTQTAEFDRLPKDLLRRILQELPDRAPPAAGRLHRKRPREDAAADGDARFGEDGPDAANAFKNLVVCGCGDLSATEVTVKMRWSTRLDRMAAVYLTRCREITSLDRITFLYDGEPVDLAATPHALRIADGDTVFACPFPVAALPPGVGAA